MYLKLWKHEIQECQIKLALNMFGGHEGLTLTRFLCFAKFRFTQRVFKALPLLVRDTLPLESCFPIILVESFLFIVKGVWFCPFDPWRWMQCIPSKHRYTPAHWYTVTFQKTLILPRFSIVWLDWTDCGLGVLSCVSMLLNCYIGWLVVFSGRITERRRQVTFSC